MSTQTHPIVGAHFRPPAKGLLAALRSNQKLWLKPEPDNPYDGNAIAVYLRPADLPTDTEQCNSIDLEVGGYGYSHKEILQMDEVHLGYIPKEIALILAATPAFKIIGMLPGTLGFTTETKRPYSITFSTTETDDDGQDSL